MSFLQEELDKCVEWVNLYLDKENPIQKVEQLQDGTKLIEIVEKLSGKKAPRYFPNGQTIFQIQENLNILLSLVKSCYGSDIMFDVTELARGNIQQFLSLVFFIAKKSNTRIEKKKKFISNKPSVNSVFESKTENSLELNTKTNNNSVESIQELNPSHSEVKSTSSDNLDNQIFQNELPVNEIQIDVVISQIFSNLNKMELITKDLEEKRINKLEKEKLSKVHEEMQIQDVPEFKKLNTLLGESVPIIDANQTNTPQLENQIDDYNKDVLTDNNLVESETVNDLIHQQKESTQQLIENEKLNEETITTQKDPGVIQENMKSTEEQTPIQQQEEIENKQKTEEQTPIQTNEEQITTQQKEEENKITTEEQTPIQQQEEIENKQTNEEQRWNEKEYDINAIKEIQRRVMGHLSRVSSHSTMRLLAQRKNIVKELIDTEQIYISRLQQFLDYYLKAVIELLPNDKLLKKCKEDILVILGYNKRIYTNLIDLQKKGYYYGQGIGSVFQKLSHFLKTYCSYVNSTDDINEHENKLRKSNKQFESTINKIRTTRKMESFNSYVILPIQRIPRYGLLLKELIKTVPPQHDEYKELYDSLQRITEVGMIVNENKRKKENQQITIQLLSKFKYSQGINPIELKGSTTFVKFGVLTLCDAEPKAKSRNVNVFLFNDNLVIAKILTTGTLHKGKLIPETLEPILESKKQLNVELVIPFERFTVVDCVDIEGSPAFGLVIDSGETLRFSCSNKDIKMSWCAKLDNQISQTQEQTLVTITCSNPELISQYKQNISINDKEYLNQLVWQGDVGDNDQYLILTGKYLALFNNVMDAYKKTSPISLYLTQCLSVIFEPPTSFSIINYCDDNKEKITFKTTSTAAALLWVFYIRQSFIKQHSFYKTCLEIFKEEKFTLQLNSCDIVYGLIQNKYNKKCADCGTTPIHCVDMDFGCFLCLKCGMIHKNFLKKLGICKIEDIQKHSVDDIQHLISLGNAFGNIERIGSCEDCSEEKTNVGDKNQYLLKKYNIEGFAHKGFVTDSQRKSRVLKLDETTEKKEIESDSQKSSGTNLERTDLSENDRKSQKKKSGEKKEKKANLSDKKRKRSIF
ncbi:protein with RhoGEF and ArfGAP domains, putative [Entamoeba nuttalli P19]|uniref:Protein with RhoGEF and ArfGAP domains, putative n=1 Tax=Entamoeba nuttalli (strain P19) TaxID=1076696 RepID=K2GWG9_ENTNP|nr:protein with RhoGEF and ArfGAP domains, putative [Entamoeba nuttalli P19]EKE38122.1 protein with RhoGEF and ArfGAP domains, putative [Entamoeba nuttalli P19]|eukprot:XP_008859545.1 protein with RhoGEF and ArfGAP domains, putative [Entamoeba nuttalli P19]